MNTFLYFIPNPKKVDAGEPLMAYLTSIGLGHVHDGDSPETREAKGPEGQGGMLLRQQIPPTVKGRKPLTCVPDQQSWIAGPPTGEAEDSPPAFWIGWWNDARPDEVSLRRKRFMKGNTVALRDKAEWMVPIAVPDFGTFTLPVVLKVGRGGKIGGVPAPEWADLCAKANRAFELLNQTYFPQGQNQQVMYDEAGAIAFAGLSANYRVSAVEVSALELVGDAEMWALLEGLVDWKQVLKEMNEKKADAAPSGT